MTPPMVGGPSLGLPPERDARTITNPKSLSLSSLPTMPQGPNAMKLYPLDLTLLRGIIGQRDALAGVDLAHHDGMDRHTLGALREQVRDARRGLLHLDVAAWLGRAPGDAERKATLRAVRRLEEAGLVIRHARWGVRITDIEVLPAADKFLQEAASDAT